MRGIRLRITTFAIVVLCLAAPSLVCLAAASLDLAADPADAIRGGWLAHAVTIENLDGGDLTDSTLYLPLPIGFDQWSAEVTIDGGPSEDYPPNGLLPLDPIPAFGLRTIVVRALVEHGAPDTFDVTAELLGASGRLATATLSSNVRPAVDAGADLISDLGASILIDGASASDGTGAIAAYAWDDGGAGGAFDDSGILRPTYTPPDISGIVELTLRVTDQDGGEASDSLRLRVNAAPEVILGGDIAAVEGQAIDLSGVTTDADGWIVGCEWSDHGAGGAFLPSASSEAPTYLVPNVAGCEDATIELTLTVTDDWGAQASDSLRMTIENANNPPTVDAGSDRLVESGEGVVLDGTAFDADGSIVSILWEPVDGPPVELAESDRLGAQFDAPAVSEAVDLTFRLTVRDNCGVEAADEMAIRVLPGDSPSGGSGSMRPRVTVSIEAKDEDGFALPPFSAPRWGSEVRFHVALTNVGSTPLSLVSGHGNGLELWDDSIDLKPSERVSSKVDVAFIPDATGRFAFEVVAHAMDPWGHPVEWTELFLLQGEEADAELALLKQADRESAAVGDSIAYTYTLINPGEIPVENLLLIDDRIGEIDLAEDRLGAGESITAVAAAVIRASDCPGPLVNRATLSGVTATGAFLRVEAEASVDIEPWPAGAGGTRSIDVGDRVVISEIAWTGSPGRPADEWIELANLSPEPVDLAGWTLCWYFKSAMTPPRSEWTTIELRGIVEPLPQTAGDERPMHFAETGGGLHRLSHAAWSNAGETASPGYFVLERQHDDAIVNLLADLVYGSSQPESYGLPDEGAVVVLLDPGGRIVDSANAQTPIGEGWAAGNPSSGATMERIDLRLGDHRGNWQTNTGVLTFGRGSDGRRMLASAGRPNPPPMGELIEEAAESVAMTTLQGSAIRLPGAAEDAPLIQMMLAGSAAGGGGAVPPRFDVRRVGADLELELQTDSTSSGTYYVWISVREGEAFLLPLSL